MVRRVWCGRCARPWCDDDGVVRVDFDGEARRIWIDDARQGRMAPALVLCRRHAGSLTPPLRWELHDLRADLSDVTGPGPEPVRRPTPAGLDVRVAPAPARLDEVLLDEVLLDEVRLDATGWLPRFDRGDDLGGVLDARSPLLSRAFASVLDRL
jgi:hypothetical protein